MRRDARAGPFLSRRGPRWDSSLLRPREPVPDTGQRAAGQETCLHWSPALVRGEPGGLSSAASERDPAQVLGAAAPLCPGRVGLRLDLLASG